MQDPGSILDAWTWLFQGMTMSQSPKLNALGKASCWTGVAGIVLSGVLSALLAKEPIWHEPEFERLREWPNALCGVLLVILDLVTLGCGIAARRTVAGKRGLWLSAFAWFPEVASWSSFGFPFLTLMLLLSGFVNRQKLDSEACPPGAQTNR
jgi:hypothetical protein